MSIITSALQVATFRRVFYFVRNIFKWLPNSWQYFFCDLIEILGIIVYFEMWLKLSDCSVIDILFAEHAFWDQPLLFRPLLYERPSLALSAVETIKVADGRRGNNREKRIRRKERTRFISWNFLETSLRKFWSPNENYKVKLHAQTTSMAKNIVHIWLTECKNVLHFIICDNLINIVRSLCIRKQNLYLFKQFRSAM